MKKQKGCTTLVGLIILAIVLAILAAFAASRYMKFRSETNTATTWYLKSSIKSAAKLVYCVAKAQIAAGTLSHPVHPNGVTVNAVKTACGKTILGDCLYPDSVDAGIVAALKNLAPGDYTIGNSTSRTSIQISKTGAPANCFVTYDIRSGTPVITATTSGC
jgi:Tfp pilus assembly major pilin PilA